MDGPPAYDPNFVLSHCTTDPASLPKSLRPILTTAPKYLQVQLCSISPRGVQPQVHDMPKAVQNVVAIELKYLPPTSEFKEYVRWYTGVYAAFLKQKLPFGLLFELRAAEVGELDPEVFAQKFLLTKALEPRTTFQVFASAVITPAPSSTVLQYVVKVVDSFLKKRRVKAPRRRVDSMEEAVSFLASQYTTVRYKKTKSKIAGVHTSKADVSKLWPEE